MTIYVDRAQWERHHGLSGHMVGDSLDELHQMAHKLGLPAENFLPFAAIPHYQLPASEQAKAIEHGAIFLERDAFNQTVKRLVLTLGRNQVAEDARKGVRDPIRRTRPAGKSRRCTKTATPQISLI